jgi:hypothetical protein
MPEPKNFAEKLLQTVEALALRPGKWAFKPTKEALSEMAL